MTAHLICGGCGSPIQFDPLWLHPAAVFVTTEEPHEECLVRIGADWKPWHRTCLTFRFPTAHLPASTGLHVEA